MTDSEFIRKELRNEIRLQKQVSYSAKNRICGSKSKRAASLPSDSLTQKQLKERNGPVMTINLSAPISWESFKAAPRDLQKMYIQKQVDTYNVTFTALGKMFNKNAQTVKDFLTKNNFDCSSFKRGKLMTDQQRSSWDVFLNGEKVVAADKSTCEEKHEEVSEEPVIRLPYETEPKMNMSKIDINFDGPYRPDQIANTLQFLLKPGENVYIGISIRKEAECGAGQP